MLSGDPRVPQGLWDLTLWETINMDGGIIIKTHQNINNNLVTFGQVILIK